jgi:hypothetical protein
MQKNAITEQQIDDIEALIKAAPKPAPRLTKEAAMLRLKPTLKAAHAAGHTPAEIAKIIGGGGIKIGARLIAALLRSGGDRVAKKRRQLTDASVNS